VISQTGSSSLSERVELLDLARRRAVFYQNDVYALDWPRLKASLGEANTASIDVHSLSERHHDAQFFVSQVRNLLRTSEEPCVLVVLTKPVAFESGEDLEPVSLESLPACSVVYIRYRAPVRSVPPFDRQMGERGRGARVGGPMTRNRPPQDVIDQLEATLKPLSPKVFDVETPEQMTKALADIEKALLTADGQSSRKLPRSAPRSADRGCLWRPLKPASTRWCSVATHDVFTSARLETWNRQRVTRVSWYSAKAARTAGVSSRTSRHSIGLR
jgi:hypothetical protein